MTKLEQQILLALEERFYNVGRYIQGQVFDPYVYIKENEAVEAINLTYNEAVAIYYKAMRKGTYHIFKNGKWVSPEINQR